MSSMMTRILELEKKIENIDNHLVLSFNLLKQAQKKGASGMVKLSNGFMEFENASKILDMKPSEGEAMLLGFNVCRSDPNDIVTKASVTIRDNKILGPWSSWIVLKS